MGCSAVSDEAKATAEQFYQYLGDNDTDKVVSLLGEQWFEKTTETETRDLFIGLKNTFGNLEQCENSAGFNFAINTKGTKVTMFYDCLWSNDKTRDTLILLKKFGQDYYRIIGYEFKSTSFETVDQFFNYLNTDKFDSIFSLLDERWFAEISKDDTRSIFVNLKKEMGNMEKCVINDSESFSSLLDGVGSTFTLSYDCSWTNGQSQDTFTLLKETGQDYYQIVHYRFKPTKE